jgi:hypothetical protein
MYACMRQIAKMRAEKLFAVDRYFHVYDTFITYNAVCIGFKVVKNTEGTMTPVPHKAFNTNTSSLHKQCMIITLYKFYLFILNSTLDL